MSNPWSALHENYKTREWIDKPSLFAQAVLEYLPSKGRLLELGAGQGQDSRFFAEHGYSVVSTDLEETALAENHAKLPAELQQSMTIQQLDLQQPLPFADDSFEVVYAHLSLHYFDQATTERIFADIYRVLKPGGVVAFFTNATTDPEYGSGEKLDDDYFFIEGKAKRYLSVKTAQLFAKDFTALLADDQGETYKDIDKGVHNLIRYIGRKDV